jgi:hypothetical protein
MRHFSAMTEIKRFYGFGRLRDDSGEAEEAGKPSSHLGPVPERTLRIFTGLSALSCLLR